VVHLYGHHLATLQFSVPADLEEQAKIARALADLDAQIAAIRSQARGLAAFKSGLLQTMFV
jgi:restriction endonuclease S subunit